MIVSLHVARSSSSRCVSFLLTQLPSCILSSHRVMFPSFGVAIPCLVFLSAWPCFLSNFFYFSRSGEKLLWTFIMFAPCWEDLVTRVRFFVLRDPMHETNLTEHEVLCGGEIVIPITLYISSIRAVSNGYLKLIVPKLRQLQQQVARGSLRRKFLPFRSDCAQRLFPSSKHRCDLFVGNLVFLCLEGKTTHLGVRNPTHMHSEPRPFFFRHLRRDKRDFNCRPFPTSNAMQGPKHDYTGEQNDPHFRPEQALYCRAPIDDLLASKEEEKQRTVRHTGYGGAPTRGGRALQAFAFEDPGIGYDASPGVVKEGG